MRSAVQSLIRNVTTRLAVTTPTNNTCEIIDLEAVRKAQIEAAKTRQTEIEDQDPEDAFWALAQAEFEDERANRAFIAGIFGDPDLVA